MTNKFLPKTVKKFNLMAVILTIVLVCSIVILAIFGVNYSANNDNGNSLIVTINSSYFQNEDKREAVMEVCETELSSLGINYTQESQMNGDDCEIVYHFDENVDLSSAKESLQKKFDDKTKDGGEWQDAFIIVSTSSQQTIAGERNIPVSYFVRTAIAVAVFAVLSFIYVLLRHKIWSALVVLACTLLTPMSTMAMVILTRIPFATYGLYAVAISAMLGAIASLLTINKYSRELKKEDKSITTAEEVVSATAVKSNSALAITLGVSVLLVGAIATTAVRWFALISLIGVGIAYFFGVYFASAMYLPLRSYADKKSATISKHGYIGATKTEKEAE